MSDETNVLLSHHDVLVCEIDNLRSDLDAVTTRAEKAEAQLAAVNKTLRACWGEDLGTLLVRVTNAEAEVVRLAGLLATKLGLDDVG